ncbi:MAG: carbon starvation CstA family protein, partial [Planctomycetota bacterium]
MESILIAVVAFAGYLIAYNTYGRYLARRIFQLDDTRETPAHEFNDGKDYVPTKLEVLFGHHYTSIAGTGPIVGPAIGIIWGWVPALVWVLLGSIFMGAVHDFGALVISARNQGKSIGDIAGRMISRRVQIMFLAIVCLALLIVIAIFCLVIASLFSMFPQSVIPIWVEVPIALVIGHLVYRRNWRALPLSIIGVILLYVFVVVGAYVPVEMPTIGPFGPLVIWTVILLIFDAFIASILPVWRLLQPRDYINGHELFVVLFILTLAVFASRPEIVAPAIDWHPSGAPPIWPFLFITIACGAISGFHSLVGSGTTSKQLSKESHALTLGYGGMLMEGVLAVLVIIAVAGGLGLAGEGGLTGVEAWRGHYSSWSAAGSLGKKVGAFVHGSANMLVALGLPRTIGITIMGVFVASFAATTLDTAT